MKHEESFVIDVPAGRENVLFVWRGGLKVTGASGVYTAGEKDTVFITGPARFKVTGDTDHSEIIQIEAPGR